MRMYERKDSRKLSSEDSVVRGKPSHQRQRDKTGDGKSQRSSGSTTNSANFEEDTSQYEMGYVRKTVRSDITRVELDHLDENLDYQRHQSPNPYFLDPEREEREAEMPPSEDQIRLEKMRAALKETRERVAMRSKTAAERARMRRQRVIEDHNHHGSPLHQGKMSDREQRDMAHRLSVSRRPKTTFHGFETMHDRVDPDEVDLKRLVRRLSAVKPAQGKHDSHYNEYFVKPSSVSHDHDSHSLSRRLSQDRPNRIAESRRTIADSPFHRNDLATSWAWRGYN